MANRLYVGNLPYSVTDAELTNFFASAGKVEKVSMVIDRATGKPRGFAFVDMSTSEEAKKAIETFAGADMQGRPLIVNEARPREERPSSGPSYGHSNSSGNNHRSSRGNSFSGPGGGGHPRFEEESRGGRNNWRNERRQNNRRGYEDND